MISPCFIISYSHRLPLKQPAYHAPRQSRSRVQFLFLHKLLLISFSQNIKVVFQATYNCRLVFNIRHGYISKIHIFLNTLVLEFLFEPAVPLAVFLKRPFKLRYKDKVHRQRCLKYLMELGRR